MQRSGERAVRQRMCTSKVRHPSRHKAHVALRELKKRIPHEARELIYYHCRMCGGGWHIGHRITDERLILLGVGVRKPRARWYAEVAA